MGELVKAQSGGLERIKDVLQAKQVLTDLMRGALVKGLDYGTVEGVEKPFLMKPGAEKIALTFGLRHEVQTETTYHNNGHITVHAKVILYHRKTGEKAGEGEGMATTLEKKYRYRWDDLGEVPKEWWDMTAVEREEKFGKDVVARKKKGKWHLFRKVEYADPADYWNTVLKMAIKRAYVAAVISTTAASEFFTQDVEDLTDTPIVQEAVVEDVREAEVLASSEQLERIKQLLEERQVPEKVLRFTIREVEKGLTAERAQKAIEKLESYPVKTKEE